MPQQRHKPRDEPHKPSIRHPSDKPGVLVVDDEHLVRIMVQLGLERNGFEVWVASNGHGAIEVYRENRERIRVVLLDVCMPGLDGRGTLDALRKLDPEVVACFMSGETSDYVAAELLQRGAAHVVAKPYPLNDLATILRRLAQGGQVLISSEDVAGLESCSDVRPGDSCKADSTPEPHDATCNFPV